MQLCACLICETDIFIEFTWMLIFVDIDVLTTHTLACTWTKLKKSNNYQKEIIYLLITGKVIFRHANIIVLNVRFAF